MAKQDLELNRRASTVLDEVHARNIPRSLSEREDFVANVPPEQSQFFEPLSSPRFKDSSSTTSFSITKQYTKDFNSIILHFRLALYHCGQFNRALVVFSITHDVFDIPVDKSHHGKPRMVLKKKSGKYLFSAAIK